MPYAVSARVFLVALCFITFTVKITVPFTQPQCRFTASISCDQRQGSVTIQDGGLLLIEAFNLFYLQCLNAPTVPQRLGVIKTGITAVHIAM